MPFGAAIAGTVMMVSTMTKEEYEAWTADQIRQSNEMCAARQAALANASANDRMALQAAGLINVTTSYGLLTSKPEYQCTAVPIDVFSGPERETSYFKFYRYLMRRKMRRM